MKKGEGWGWGVGGIPWIFPHYGAPQLWGVTTQPPPPPPSALSFKIKFTKKERKKPAGLLALLERSIKPVEGFPLPN